MILSFTVQNFLSIKEKQTISLIADSLKEHKEYLHIPYNYDANFNVLKSAVIFGHNSSGKSNLLKAFAFMQNLIFDSFAFASTNKEIPIEVFKLNQSTLTASSLFEVIFIANDIKYRYGFEIKGYQIVSEWLFYAESRVRENYLFIRNRAEFKLSKTWNKEVSNKAEKATLFAKSNVLFLSILMQQERILHIDAIGQWLKKNIVLLDINDEKFFAESALIISNPDYRRIINFFISEAQLGFSTIEEKIESKAQNLLRIDSNLIKLAYEREIINYELYTKHKIFDKDYKEVGYEYFDFLKSESSGTQKFFILVSQISFALMHGGILWIDEIDSRFHSLLLELIIRLYNSSKLNVSGSQMIFTSHNTIILNKKLRRDQVHFAEKNEYGESTIRRMHTAQTPVRVDSSVEREYLSGKLGGVPKIKGESQQGEIKFE